MDSSRRQPERKEGNEAITNRVNIGKGKRKGTRAMEANIRKIGMRDAVQWRTKGKIYKNREKKKSHVVKTHRNPKKNHYGRADDTGTGKSTVNYTPTVKG